MLLRSIDNDPVTRSISFINAPKTMITKARNNTALIDERLSSAWFDWSFGAQINAVTETSTSLSFSARFLPNQTFRTIEKETWWRKELDQSVNKDHEAYIRLPNYYFGTSIRRHVMPWSGGQIIRSKTAQTPKSNSWNSVSRWFWV